MIDEEEQALRALSFGIFIEITIIREQSVSTNTGWPRWPTGGPHTDISDSRNT